MKYNKTEYLGHISIPRINNNELFICNWNNFGKWLTLAEELVWRKTKKRA